MNWLNVIALVLMLLRALVEFLREREKISTATAQVLLESGNEMRNAIDQAQRARQSVRADIVRHPADILSDDGFKRDD